MLRRSNLLLIGGLLLTLAAIPVFAQQDAVLPAPQINRAPVKELSRAVEAKLRNGEIDLGVPFSFEIELAADESGKFDTSKMKVVKAEGDQKLIDIVEASIQAINDAGYLAYLNNLGGRNFTISVSQNDSMLAAGIVAEVASEARARNLKVLLSSLIRAVIEKNKDSEISKIREINQELFNAVAVEAEGNKLLVKFALPKSLIQEQIKAIIAAKPASK